MLSAFSFGYFRKNAHTKRLGTKMRSHIMSTEEDMVAPDRRRIPHIPYLI